MLAADVVGYGRLTETYEEATHDWLMRLRSEVLDPGIVAHRGRVIKNTGDGFLAMFESAHEATQCALKQEAADDVSSKHRTSGSVSAWRSISPTQSLRKTTSTEME